MKELKIALIFLIGSIQFSKAQLCFPMDFGGIVPGITMVQDVVTLYGEGFFDEHQGHGGGHVYTNYTMTATLMVVIGMDHYIESVWIKKGIEFPDSVLKNTMAFISPRFEITNNGSLSVGLDASKDMIKAKYGVPTDMFENGNIWSYESKLKGEGCFFETSLSFWFKNKICFLDLYYDDDNLALDQNYLKAFQTLNFNKC